MSDRATGLRFSLFGVPVTIEPFFFIIPLFALQSRSVQGALVWTALVFTGVLVHEFGHALAMRAFGLNPTITLHAMGGWTHYPQGAHPSPGQSLLVSLSGPGAGLILGSIAFVIQSVVQYPPPALAMALRDAMWINIGWSIINLLPILPWDGGHVLDYGLHWLTGKRRDRIVAATSIIGGGVIVFLAIRSQSILLGYFGGMGIFNGYQRLNAKKEAPGKLGSRNAAEQRIWELLSQGQVAAARQAVQSLWPQIPSISLQARLAAADNDVDAVIRLLDHTNVEEIDRPLLLSALVIKERFDDAVRLAQQYSELAPIAAARLLDAGATSQALLFFAALRSKTGQGVYAFEEARCLCRLGRLDEAAVALQKAKLLGYSRLGDVLTDSDFESVRDRREIQLMVQT